jgi:hypothetical protein
MKMNKRCPECRQRSEIEVDFYIAPAMLVMR